MQRQWYKYLEQIVNGSKAVKLVQLRVQQTVWQLLELLASFEKNKAGYPRRMRVGKSSAGEGH